MKVNTFTVSKGIAPDVAEPPFGAIRLSLIAPYIITPYAG